MTCECTYNESCIGCCEECIIARPYSGANCVACGGIWTPDAPTTGSISCTTTPSGASITIDGTLQTGIVTPATITGVNPGGHTVLFKLNAYNDCSKSVTVVAGSTINATCVMTIQYGSISCNSSPAGAEIFLDSQDTLHVTPYIIPSVVAGGHSVMFRLIGYNDCINPVNVLNNTQSNVSCTLTPSAGSITCTSTPTGAQIYLDGINTALTTPHQLTNITPGNHTVLFRLIGYNDCTLYPISVVAGQDTSASCTLTCIPNWLCEQPLNGWEYDGCGNRRQRTDGTCNPLVCTSATVTADKYSAYTGDTITLTVSTQPTTQSFPVIFKANGIQIGSTCNTTNGTCTMIWNTTGLTAGNYNITAEVTGQCVSASVLITLTTPPVQTGNISITSTPSGARIFFDGGDTTQVTPYTFYNVAVGTHALVFKLTGYNDCTKNVDVLYGSTANVACTLTAIPTTGNVNLTSSPSGARIWIDNVDQTVNTPYTITGLSPGSHTYKLTLSGYIDAIATFNIVVGQTTTVPTVTLTPSVTTGNVNITSNPSGARIWIDNVDQLINTPMTIGNISAGSHTFKLTLTGYNDYSSTFNIVAGQTTTVPIVNLTPSVTTGNVNLSSSPSGASITIDNIFQSGITTPTTITGLSAGNHTFKLTLAGYNEYTGSFSITIGQTTTVPMVTLVPAATTGSVNLSSIPSGASIFIDNVFQSGTITPVTISNISAGSHSFKLTLAGYNDYSSTFNIVAGQMTTVPTITLTSSVTTGSVNITSTPSGARIWIDNIDQTVNTPSTITGLSIGSHTFKLMLAGYNDYSSTFNIVAGQMTTVPMVTLVQIVTHKECIGNTCVDRPGAGNDLCAVDANCQAGGGIGNWFNGTTCLGTKCISNTYLAIGGGGVGLVLLSLLKK